MELFLAHTFDFAICISPTRGHDCCIAVKVGTPAAWCYGMLITRRQVIDCFFSGMVGLCLTLRRTQPSFGTDFCPSRGILRSSKFTILFPWHTQREMEPILGGNPRNLDFVRGTIIAWESRRFVNCE